MSGGRIDLTQYIVISVWFGCNNDCSICMLSGLKGLLPPIGFERFREVLVDIANDGQFENLILSGAEVTTFDDLGEYVHFARSLGWFKNIQIQTNGRRLHDTRYLDDLIECGVNEFFVSIHGTEGVHDLVTRTDGAFQETLAGIRNIGDSGANLISNTVLTRANIHNVPQLVEILVTEKISEIHLWNYYPMERRDSKDLVVSMSDFLTLLTSILPIVKGSGIPLVLKSFPECLPIEQPAVFDSGYPVTILPDIFWRQFSENDFGYCVYRDACAACECWGLSRAYRDKYGDEEGLLVPIPRSNTPV